MAAPLVAKWYLRTSPSKPAQGPFDIAQLERYAAAGQLRPGMELSRDGHSWIPSEQVPLSGDAETDANGHYLRIRGQVSGPFSRDELAQRVRMGKLAAIHEVSTDRANWRPASSIDGLFGPSGDSAPPAHDPYDEPPAAPPAPAAIPVLSPRAEIVPVEVGHLTEPRGWYYAIAGKREGPVGLETLNELMRRRVLTPDDLVYADGMPDWVALRSVPEVYAGHRSREKRDRDRDRDRGATRGGRDFEVGPAQIMAAILLLIAGLADLMFAFALFAYGELMSNAASFFNIVGANAHRNEAIGESTAAVFIGLVLLAMGLAILADGIGVFMAKAWSIHGMRGVGVLNAVIQGLCIATATGGVIGNVVLLAVSAFWIVVGYTTTLAQRTPKRRSREDRR